jgi:hypothetical protein
MRKAMLARSIQVLDRGSVVPPENLVSVGYAECRDIDSDGHVMGLRLAAQLQTEIARSSNTSRHLRPPVGRACASPPITDGSLCREALNQSDYLFRQ